MSIGLERDQSVVVGLPGARTTQTLLAAIVFDPLRDVQIRLDGNASPIDGEEGIEDDDTELYGVRAELSYALAAWLGVRVGYGFSYQRDGDGVARHLFTLGLDVTYPIHVY
jgi:hypothetical protein